MLVDVKNVLTSTIHARTAQRNEVEDVKRTAFAPSPPHALSLVSLCSEWLVQCRKSSLDCGLETTTPARTTACSRSATSRALSPAVSVHPSLSPWNVR